MKYKIKSIILSLLGIIFVSCSVEEDFVKVKEKNGIPTFKTLTYEQTDEKFKQLSQRLAIEQNLKIGKSSLLQSRTIKDTLGFMIETEIIKQVTLGNYKSYTMKIVQQENDIIFYNLTIEDRDGTESMFITQYIPSEYWLNNKDDEFKGGITSKKINKLTENTNPEIIFDNLGVGTGGGGGGSLGNNYSLQEGSPIYPFDCNGYVIMSMKLIQHPCAEGLHMPGQNCYFLNPSYQYYDPSKGPYEELVPYYYCMEFPNMSGNNPDNPDNSTPGGTTIPDVPIDTSIAAMIKPEECTKRIVGDLNGDCMLSPYEMCLLNSNSTEVCDCVEQGGNLDTCLDKNDCKNLNNLLASDKTNLNNYISQLVTKHNSNVKKEYIYSLRKEIQDYDIDTGEVTYNYLPPFEAEGTATSIQVQVDTKTYADIHLHTKDEGAASSIFSWGDIYEFNKFYDGISNAQPIATFKEKNDIMTMLVAPDAENLNNYNVYALTIGDKTALQTAVQNEWNSPKWAHITNVKERKEAINQDVGEKYVNYKECVERFFLDNFSTYGIKLYKMENNQWDELLVDTDTMDKVSKKTCD